MQPANLTPGDFVKYPDQGRAVAVEYLSELKQLPIPLAVVIVKELSNFDWLFPMEQLSIRSQLQALRTLPAAARVNVVDGFGALSLPSSLSKQDWINAPEDFIESMTAILWSTHQIDAFSAAARNFSVLAKDSQQERPPAIPRLCIVVLGEGVRNEKISLFSKLRAHGTFFPNVDSSAGMETVLAAISNRSLRSPRPYDHWYIDGGQITASQSEHYTCISWAALAPVRDAILQRMQESIRATSGGPASVRTRLAKMSLMDIGVIDQKDQVLSRFALSILTEGSGTQVFSTTFVQWATREVLRRAQPSTLVARFAPRQRQLSMDELLANETKGIVPDPAGSLLDADIAAFYTWINQQRLAGADRAYFVAWSQEHNQAIAIGPNCPKGMVVSSIQTVEQILER